MSSEEAKEEKTFKLHVLNDSMIVRSLGMTAVLPRSDERFNLILERLNSDSLTDDFIKKTVFQGEIAKFEDFLKGLTAKP